MKRLDYSDAKMWYEEGVSQCDAYSIDQLTTIWLSNERMRPSMRSLMNKCLNCLTVKATEDDPDAISKLIIYYSEGIGTPKSEELATYWKEYQEMLLKPAEPEAVKEGVDLIFGKFMGYLSQQGVKPIEAIGKPFDTEEFEAIATIPAPEPDMKGKVLDCVQTGYTLFDKVIRHAKVVVGE